MTIAESGHLMDGYSPPAITTAAGDTQAEILDFPAEHYLSQVLGKQVVRYEASSVTYEYFDAWQGTQPLEGDDSGALIIRCFVKDEAHPDVDWSEDIKINNANRPLTEAWITKLGAEGERNRRRIRLLTFNYRSGPGLSPINVLLPRYYRPD